tara:strand:- start:42093 stop:43265 length:1173 start_codon:yes stop_codon:yes gene_type:complete
MTLYTSQNIEGTVISAIGVNSDNVISGGNWSGNIYTGSGEQNGFNYVGFNLQTDEDGTFTFEFSQDGTNWSKYPVIEFGVSSGINEVHGAWKGGRYIRPIFTGTGGRSYFRLQVYYSNTTITLTSPLNQGLSIDQDAVSVRPSDFTNETASGKRDGISTWNKWGYNDDVDTGALEVIASWGGSYTPPTTATELSIVSTDANDIVTTGTGLNAIVITGIDENRTQQIEVVELNGVTPVVTGSVWLGINRVAPFLCGTSKINEGTITITAVTGGDTLAQMPLGETVTQQAIFHVQSNHTFLASWLHINVLKLTGGGSAPEVTIRGIVFSPTANAYIQVFKTKIDTAIENSIEFNNPELLPITENSVLFFTAETNTNNTSIDVRFSGKEQENI